MPYILDCWFYGGEERLFKNVYDLERRVLWEITGLRLLPTFGVLDSLLDNIDDRICLAEKNDPGFLLNN